MAHLRQIRSLRMMPQKIDEKICLNAAELLIAQTAVDLRSQIQAYFLHYVHKLFHPGILGHVRLHLLLLVCSVPACTNVIL